MHIGAFTFFFFLLAGIGCILSLIIRDECYSNTTERVAGFFAGILGITFIYSIVHIVVFSFQDWRYDTPVELTVTVVDGAAVIKDGDKLINLNKETGIQFEAGEKVKVSHASTGPYVGLYCNSGDIKIEKGK